MDRRQKRSRESIFKAFIQLLSRKNFNSITVGEIIDLADVGRATFYAHFETKDFLLKELCKELFEHLFYAEKGVEQNKNNIFQCEETGSAIIHLFRHVKRNDNNICKLLSSKNNSLFLEYFKNGVRGLIMESTSFFRERKPTIVPESFWLNYVTCTFIETLKWWLENKMEQTPEQITEYFLKTV